MNLNELARKHHSDKGYVHDYMGYYETHFGPTRNDPLTLIEVGVLEGASLRMWADWMPNAKILGVDKKLYSHVIHPRIGVTICDIWAYEPEEDFDIIIDDGSHLSPDIIKAHELLWPRLKSGGWYVIEDLEQLWTGRVSGEPAMGLLTNSLLDAIRQSPGEFTEVHAYRQIVFLRKL